MDEMHKSPLGPRPVRILTNQTKRDHPLWLRRVELLPGWRNKIDRSDSSTGLGSYWSDLRWAWKLFRSSKHFEAVVTGSERSAIMFALLQLLLRRERKPHVIIYTHWNLPSSFFAQSIKRLLYRLVCRGVRRIIVYSERQLELYVKTYGLPKERFSCVKYHTTLYDCKDPVTPVSARGDYVFSGGDYTRDYRTLIEAARQLPYRVVIAALFRDYFKGLDIPPNVEIVTTSHEGFFELMAGAKVIAVPLCGGLQHSGGQQTYLNAMAMGKTVVVADDCGADEYIQSGLSGIVVPPGDVQALRQALRSAYENSSFASMLARNAKLAAEAFSPESFFERVFEIVEQYTTVGQADRATPLRHLP
jgi:glycosyltransferase involved in cell wall biosynthesis